LFCRIGTWKSLSTDALDQMSLLASSMTVSPLVSPAWLLGSFPFAYQSGTVELVKAFAWGRFHEKVSAVIFHGQNLIVFNIGSL
jgi:hypothetical protein